MTRHQLCRGAVAILVACCPLVAAEFPTIQIHRLNHRAGADTRSLSGSRPASDVAQLLRERLLAAASGERPYALTESKVMSSGVRMIDPGARRVGSGTLLELRGESAAHEGIVPLAVRAAEDDLTIARQFLRRNAGALHIYDPDSELILERQERDELGRRHLRFTQQYRGTPVWPGDLIVHLDARGNVDLVDGAFV